MSFEDVLRHEDRINALSRSLIGRPAFERINVQLPDPDQPEPGFIRATSWLYCLYFEGGRTSIGFLLGLGEAYRFVDRAVVEKHMEEVRYLRTELHHNLGFEDSDQQARTAAEAWKRKACGTAVPNDNEHWRQCYERLVEEAGRFLRAIEDLVRQLELDGDAASRHLEEWCRRLERNWSAASFDPLIADAASRLGRAALKIVSFRNRHAGRWRKKLELLEDGFDFSREASLLIEKTLLDDGSLVLPVSGRDIIDELGIEPGPAVGRLLEEALRFFQTEPCGATEVLAHLRKYHDEPAPSRNEADPLEAGEQG